MGKFFKNFEFFFTIPYVQCKKGTIETKFFLARPNIYSFIQYSFNRLFVFESEKVISPAVAMVLVLILIAAVRIQQNIANTKSLKDFWTSQVMTMLEHGKSIMKIPTHWIQLIQHQCTLVFLDIQHLNSVELNVGLKFCSHGWTDQVIF